MLFILNNIGSCSLPSLQKETGYHYQTILTRVANLADMGLIQKVRDPSDSRCVQVKLADPRLELNL
jgi:DNA-binding MarR family transcriptional regulator